MKPATPPREFFAVGELKDHYDSSPDHYSLLTFNPRIHVREVLPETFDKNEALREAKIYLERIGKWIRESFQKEQN